jgi:hypothetical protein
MSQPDRDTRKAALLDVLSTLSARIFVLDPASRTTPEMVRDLEAQLGHDFPPEGPVLQQLRALVAEGVRDGWLCDRGEPEARFSRVAKPGPLTHGMSVDVVSLQGRAVEHTHPKGEVTIGFVAPEPADSSATNAPTASDGTATSTFDGRPPGWVFLPPGSRHVPSVVGPRMHLVYFLPDGAVEWHMAG